MERAKRGSKMKKFILSAVLVALFVPGYSWSKIGGGDITFKVPGATNVVFSHDDHVTRRGIKCGECHYRIFTTVEGHRKATMADMGKGQSCGACHNGNNAFSVTTKCAACHR